MLLMDSSFNFKKALQEKNIIWAPLSIPSQIIFLLQPFYGQKVCYVTLNKPAGRLQQAFFFHHLPDVFFIDAVSRSLGEAQEQENVLYLSSPMALNELESAVQEVLASPEIDVVIFDAISMFFIYHQECAAEQTILRLLQSARKQQKKVIFLGSMCFHSQHHAFHDVLPWMFHYLSRSHPHSCSSPAPPLFLQHSIDLILSEDVYLEHPNARSAILLPVLGAGLLAGLIFATGNSSVTGLAILSSPVSYSSFPLVGGVALLVLLFTLWYKKAGLHSLSFLSLAALSSPPLSPLRLQRQVRRKLHLLKKRTDTVY